MDINNTLLALVAVVLAALYLLRRRSRLNKDE